jgi:two-component sensor histidine kinase/AmiR/NasT family two-component response regulator
MKILLIEDNAIARLLFEKQIRALGYEVTACETAEAALEAYQQMFYPLIILDLGLPGMDGFEFSRRIRALPKGEQSMILVITAYDQPEDLQAALDAGVDDYLVKPVEMSLLHMRLTIIDRQFQNLTERKRAEAELETYRLHLEELVKERTAELQQEISERRRMEAQIKASLKEKEILLREIHHRVKNNMQAISSLMRLQSRKFTDDVHLEIFREVENRIQSMALIHEMLYHEEDFARIEFERYVIQLVFRLLGVYGIRDGRITPHIQVENVCLGLDTAIPCGLLINELVTNSLKYAFPEDRTGELAIDLRSSGDETFELSISDNGIGLPEDLDFRKSETLGFTLVMSWVNQLQADIELDRTIGTRFHIVFKELKYKTPGGTSAL